MNVAKSYNRRGLVGHWKYHGNVSALGTWYDISGNGNHGTLVGNAFVDSNGVNLDGSGDYVRIANNSSLTPSSSLTINEWIYIDVATDPNEIFATVTKEGLGSSSYGINILGSSYGGQENEPEVFIFSGVNTWVCDANVSLNTNTLYMITGTYDGSTIKIYVNGELINTESNLGSINQGSAEVRIGSSQEFPIRNMNGKIDDVRIYNRALSAEEISQLYHQTRRF